MPNLSATLAVVHQYLVVHGYNPKYMTITGEGDQAAAVHDGHWLVGWCRHYGSGDICPCGIPIALKHLFALLEGNNRTLGQPPRVREAKWTRVDTNNALRAGGYEPYEH